jgi:hypothetical protein
MRGDWLWCRGSKGLAGQVNGLVVSTAVGVATERAGFSNWNFWAEFANEAFQLHGERGDAAFSTGAADAAGSVYRQRVRKDSHHPCSVMQPQKRGAYQLTRASLAPPSYVVLAFTRTCVTSPCLVNELASVPCA